MCSQLSPTMRYTMVVMAWFHWINPIAPVWAVDSNAQGVSGLESLSLLQATALAEGFPGEDATIAFAGFGKHTLRHCLNLRGVKAIDKLLARELAGYRRGPLLLDGVRAMDVASAEALSGLVVPLSMNVLTEITAGVARGLAKIKGESLFLNGVSDLNPDAAAALTEYEGALYLAGLTRLTPETAAKLGESKADYLFLRGLTTLDPETARGIARFEGSLCIDGITDLSPDAATELAKSRQSWMILRGLATLNPEVARALSGFSGGWLCLDGLISLDPRAARELEGYDGTLSLTGLTSLSADAARSLSAVPGWNGVLPGIVALEAPDSTEVAEALVKRKGKLSLKRLRKVSPKTLAILQSKKDVLLPPRRYLTFIPEPGNSGGNPVGVSGRVQTKQADP